MTATRPLPRAPGHWLLGNAHAMRDRPHTFVAEIGHANGGLAQLRILHRRMIAVTGPDLIRQVLITRHDRYERSFHYRTAQLSVGKGLLTTDGPVWKVRRRQVQPAFRPEALQRLVPAVHGAAGEMFARWDQKVAAGEPVPLLEEMQTFALTVMCRALLSVSIDSAEARRFGEAVRSSLYLVRRRNTSLCPMPRWVPDRTNRALRETYDVLDAYVALHLRPRREGREPPKADIAQALLDARDPETGEPLSWQALRDETKTLFTAGFETSATMLAWALHSLSHHPAVAAAWRAEIDDVLSGRPATWDDLPRLVVTDRIVQETLRLYPPVYTLGRVCVEDDELGGCRISRGSTLLLSVYGAHRDPAFWTDPARFDPDRFAPGREWARHAFLPFALGKHTCVGNNFAVAEAVLGLATIGQRYRIEPTVDYQVPIRPQVTLVPAREIPVRFVRR
ncbi:MAG TPA: cytochrome P450 [Opitutaceae bacterium]|nr:cytochrome P450 [Opitutaceae bacterium]